MMIVLIINVRAQARAPAHGGSSSLSLLGLYL